MEIAEMVIDKNEVFTPAKIIYRPPVPRTFEVKNFFSITQNVSLEAVVILLELLSDHDVVAAYRKFMSENNLRWYAIKTNSNYMIAEFYEPENRFWYLGYEFEIQKK